MQRIILSNGDTAILDDEDFVIYSRWKWKSTNGYAARNTTTGAVLLHRLIAQVPKGAYVVFRNGNKLDVRKKNLEIVDSRKDVEGQRYIHKKHCPYCETVFAKRGEFCSWQCRFAERLREAKEGKGEDDCWEWTRRRNHKGYGTFSADGKSRLAHIMSFQFHGGQYDPALCVCHHCDNPPCINPKHLFHGTHQDNALDREAKGRGADNSGENHGQSLLSNEERKALVEMYRTHSSEEVAECFGVSKQFVISAAVKFRKKNPDRAFSKSGKPDSTPDGYIHVADWMRKAGLAGKHIGDVTKNIRNGMTDFLKVGRFYFIPVDAKVNLSKCPKPWRELVLNSNVEVQQVEIPRSSFR